MHAGREAPKPMSDTRALLNEMHSTLLAEFGARAIYGQLARLSRDAELAAVLVELRADEEQQVRGMQELIVELGGRPARRSLRRSALAGALALCGAILGPRVALRVCCEAERRASRWYAAYQSYFQAEGRLDLARRAAALGMTKHRHSEVLATWVEHAPRRLTKS